MIQKSGLVLIALVIVLACNPLFARKELEESKLRITYDSDLLHFRLENNLDFSDRWMIRQQPELTYSHLMLPEVMPQTDSDTQRNFYLLSLMGGSEPFADFRFSLFDPDEPLYALRISGQHREPESGWWKRDVNLRWHPEFDAWSLHVDGTHRRFSMPDIHETGINKGSIQFRAWDIPLGFLRLRSFEVDITGSQLSRDFDAFEDKQEFGEVDFKGDFEFSAGNDLRFQLQPLFLRTALSGSALVEYHLNGILQSIGVWMSADDENLFPSASFHAQFPLDYNLEIFAMNSPHTNAESRLNLLTLNPHQYLKMDHHLTRYPVDAALGIQYDGLMRVDGAYHVQMATDIPYYAWVDSLYFFGTGDCLRHGPGFSFSWEYNEFQLTNRFQLFLTSPMEDGFDVVPYLPDLENSLEFSYNTPKWYGSLTALYTGMRENAQGDALEGALGIDISGGYRFNPSLELTSALENLLDAETSRFTDVPGHPVTVRMGLIWAF